ncbi:sugar ABC transporter substrate-binding protein [uncultured Sphaerochaeta sp.]|uniref:ABC transporter substrate-binding protein n=1 Tax=uncultured Sphaerochaeta sp. TaxID=886478 RepID=UPI002A0A2243|nr:sugar ABC transporter substrate-binding protein [uncultured Sphaerochaeta sp.]
MKKTLCIILVFVMAMSFVWANGTSEKKADKKITLTWYQWFDAETHEKELKPIIAEFEKTHPNVHIELSAISSETYWDRLALDIASGVEGDIVTLDTGAGLAGYYSQRKGGAFIPLEKYIKGKVLDDGTRLEQDVYLIDSVKKDDHVIALPYIMFSAPMTAYRKSQLQAAGISADQLGNWDSYLDAAKTLTQDTDGDGKIDIYGWGHPTFVETLSRWWHMHWLWTAGGGIFPNEEAPYTADRLIFNGKENVQAVEFMKKMHDETAPSGIKTVTDIHAMFANGSVATCQIAVWTLANLKAMMGDDYNTDLGMANFPSDGDKAPVLVSWGNPLAISSKCEHPDEAFEFIAFLHGKYAQKLAMRRAAPTNKLVYDDYARDNPKQAEFIQACQNFEMRNVPDIIQWNEFDHIVQQSISDALLGTKSVQEALDWGQEEMKKALQ